MHQRFGAGYHSSTILENSVGSPGEEGMHSVHAQRLCCFLGENSTLQDVFPPPQHTHSCYPCTRCEVMGEAVTFRQALKVPNLGHFLPGMGETGETGVCSVWAEQPPSPSGAPEGKQD